MGQRAAHTPPVHASLVRLQAPAQQGWPVAPHGVHFPAAPQTKPLPQGVSPAQHGWPLAPQAAQLVPTQTVPAEVQVLPAQQGPARPPQNAHVVPEQIVPTPVQTLPEQQGWVAPPQATHSPAAVHRLPLPQTDPQHDCPVPPHATQLLPPPQSVTPGVQLPPTQQGWVTPPHVAQVVPEQT